MLVDQMVGNLLNHISTTPMSLKSPLLAVSLLVWFQLFIIVFFLLLRLYHQGFFGLFFNAFIEYGKFAPLLWFFFDLYWNSDILTTRILLL
jgi:hypothetical protein